MLPEAIHRVEVLEMAFAAKTNTKAQVEVGHSMEPYVGSGTQVHVPMGTDAAESMCAGLVMRQEKLERSISPHLVIVPLGPGKMISIPSTTRHPEFYGGWGWNGPLRIF